MTRPHGGWLGLGACVVLAGLCDGLAKAEPAFALKDGDVVAFYGDSITVAPCYGTVVENYVATRFPTYHVRMLYAGVGGDSVAGGAAGGVDDRLARDVVAGKATVVTVMLGMNDGQYKPASEAGLVRYAAGMEHIVDVLERALPGVRITLLEPSPCDPVNVVPKDGFVYNDVLLEFGKRVRALAQRRDCSVVDVNAPLVDVLRRAHAVDPTVSRAMMIDAPHPSRAGHLVLGAAILSAWQAPAVVSSVVIDAGQGRATVENATVSDVAVGTGGMTWRQLDHSLPFPIERDPPMALSVRLSGFQANLNMARLCVTGLGAPAYTLKIDGRDVGVFAAEDLSAGINLSEHETPMMSHAQAVARLTNQHLDLDRVRRSNLGLGRWQGLGTQVQDIDSTSIPKALAAVEAADADVLAARFLAAQPVVHAFELTETRP